MQEADHKKLIQEYYSTRAKDYDTQKVRTWKSDQGFADELFIKMIDSLKGLKNKTILEISLGTGRTSLPLLERLKPTLVGIDLSKEMLNIAKNKMRLHKQIYNLILGDAEHLPLTDRAFAAVICTSAMHYFTEPEKSLAEISRVLNKEGIFLYGDLTLHELDNEGFLNRLEKTVSHAHESYFRPSEIENFLENHRFRVLKTETYRYRKSFNSLIEDKGRYFGVEAGKLAKCVQMANDEERSLYSINNNELTLYYTLIKAFKTGT